MARRIIVTGATGVVGSALVQHLERSGAEVVAVRGRGDCNLEDPDLTNRFFRGARAEEVYHLAGAVFGVGGNLAFPGDAFRRNVLINTNTIEACRLAGVRKIVAMGSAAMYGDGIAQPMRADDALLGEPHGSEFAYAYSKRAMLVQLVSYRQQFGLDYAFAIATNMYGPHDRFDPEYGHVIPSLLIKFARARHSGGSVSIWGDGSPTRDFLFSSDAAAGLELMMRSGTGRYNLATGRSVPISDLVSEIARLFPDVDYGWDTTKPLGQLRRIYDVTPLAALGFEPRFDLREGLRMTVDWLRSNLDDVRAYAA